MDDFPIKLHDNSTWFCCLPIHYFWGLLCLSCTPALRSKTAFAFHGAAVISVVNHLGVVAAERNNISTVLVVIFPIADALIWWQQKMLFSCMQVLELSQVCAPASPQRLRGYHGFVLNEFPKTTTWNKRPLRITRSSTELEIQMNLQVSTLVMLPTSQCLFAPFNSKANCLSLCHDLPYRWSLV